MRQEENLIVSRTDFEKLSLIINGTRSEVAEMLEEELARAEVVGDESLPTDVVAMNSKVSFQDLENNKESIVILVYPNESNIDENKISILTPVGSALIGLRVGQEIRWPLPNGRFKQLKVTSVNQ